MGKIELNLKRRDLLKKQEYYLQMKVEIFEAAIVAKDKAYNDYESATSWHDKAKALYMFEIIERCLDKFTVVHIDKKD